MDPLSETQGSKNVSEEGSDAAHFDRWALHYDKHVRSSPETFPFAGYKQVLDEIVRRADVNPGMRILDLGTGTGNLAERFIELGCSVWGIDFSREMLAQAKEKCPRATFFQGDLQGDWPAFFDHRFDRVVSAYALHHFDLPTKVQLIEQGIRLLEDPGRIVIGDISFETATAREQAHKRWTDLWDETEYYWAGDETVTLLNRRGFRSTYTQNSSCGGVFVIERRR